MTLSTFIANPSTTTGMFAVAGNRDRGTLVSPAIPDHTSCRLQIDRAVEQIESPEVRAIVGAVFQDLLRLLECLSLIESHLRKVDAAEETFALFHIINEEARALVEFIREDALTCEAMNEELSETLDGITFAVNHDLQRVFENEQHGVISEKTAHVVVGKLYRAHDVLTNCLQQSTITLAMMFDSELVGTRLFNNSDMRYRQSLQLCEDLSALLHVVETSEKQSDEPALSSLTACIEKFRNESMECLMYSDWPQFESFCEGIKVAATSAAELEPVLHQFRCYVETLLGQVRMRAVLANVVPVRFGADDSVQHSGPGAPDSTQFSPSFDLPDEYAEWDVFAVAV
jgi:hypothetical protein